MLKSRRDFFRLTGSALWVTAGAAACAGSGGAANTTPNNPGNAAGGGDGAMAADGKGGFLMMQISDTHWGYQGPANPDPHATIDRALAEIAAWPQKPDLVIHTGDVTQLTTDGAQRKQRLAEAKAAFSKLGVELKAIPGEHDASLDKGAAFQEAFGPTHWAFEHKGVYMIGLDNASNPQGGLGEEQMAWFEKEVTKVPATSRL
ncbi:MAG TPA: metallophosphoesterase, partial [Kofleriaceae bacterium]|nr:metallophosphoesterase [Kofleriaceae bacterium]